MDTLISYLNVAGGAFIDFALPMLIQSSILIAILLGLDYILRKRVRAVFRYCIWMLVLLKLLLPTSLAAPSGIMYWLSLDLPQPAHQQSVKVSQPAIIAPLTESIDHIAAEKTILTPPSTVDTAPAALSIESQPVHTATAPPPTTAPNSITWQAIVSLLWLSVVITLMLLLLQRLFFVRGLIAQSIDTGDMMEGALLRCSAQMGIKRKIAVKLSANASSPSVCGLFRPTILIPADLPSKLDSDHIEAVLLHELAHIKRQDLRVSFIQTILQIIYFYNPLLWLANSIIRRTREQAVDEMVQVAMGEKAENYPETLVNVFRMSLTRPALGLRLIGVVESKSSLRTRIKHMINRPTPKTTKLGIAGSLAILITAAALLPMATAQQEPIATVPTSHALHLAASNGHIETTELLIANGADVNAKDANGNTPLHNAASNGHDGTTSMLIIERAHVNAKNTDGLTPLDLAASKGHKKVVQILIENGADVPTKPPSTTAYTATLPNGATVELLGVCEHPSEGKQWWRADGSLLADEPYAKLGWGKSGGPPLYEFAVSVDGNDSEDISVASKSPHSNDNQWVNQRRPKTANDEHIEGLYAFIGSFDKNSDSGDVSFGVARGNWETVDQWDHYDWTADGVDVMSFESDKSVVFTWPRDYQGGFVVSVTHTLVDEATRLILIDKHGKEHIIGHEIIGQGAGIERHIYTYHGITRADIELFAFEKKPYQWITFKNVSLEPNYRTDVQIEVDNAGTQQRSFEKALESIKRAFGYRGKQDSALPDTVPNSAKEIEAVLQKWYANCRTLSIERLRETYVPEYSLTTRDAKELNRLLDQGDGPEWEFGLLSVLWDSQNALAVSHKVTDPRIGQAVLVWSLRNIHGNWRIADIDLDGAEHLQINNSRFLQNNPDAKTWFDDHDLTAIQETYMQVEGSGKDDGEESVGSQKVEDTTILFELKIFETKEPIPFLAFLDDQTESNTFVVGGGFHNTDNVEEHVRNQEGGRLVAAPQLLTRHGQQGTLEITIGDDQLIKISVAGKKERENTLSLQCSIESGRPEGTVAARGNGATMRASRMGFKLMTVVGEPMILGGMRTAENVQYVVLTASYPLPSAGLNAIQEIDVQKAFIPDADTDDTNTVLDLATGEMVHGFDGVPSLQEYRKMGKGDLAYDRVFICIRGAQTVLWDGSSITPLPLEQKIEDATAYKLETIPCRLLVTTAENDMYDVTVLSKENRGINIEYRRAEKNKTKGQENPDPELYNRWLNRIVSLKTHKQAAFAVLPQLLEESPDFALGVARDAWPRITNHKVKQGILKAFHFAKHPHTLRILDLGVRDSNGAVVAYALTYVSAYSGVKFPGFCDEYNEWYEQNRDKTLDQIFHENKTKRHSQHDQTLEKMLAHFAEETEWTDLWNYSRSLGGAKYAFAIPAMIGIIDADNSYDTIYGVGYFGLTRITGVDYSPFHDGSWWRRWWQKNKTQYSKAVQDTAIPSLTKTSHGLGFIPYPDDIDTTDGMIRWITAHYKHLKKGYPSWSDVAQEFAKWQNAKAIPYLLAAMDADPSGSLTYDIAYRGLDELTGVPYDVSYDTDWWKTWWQDNKTRYPKNIQALDIEKIKHQYLHPETNTNIRTAEGLPTSQP